MLKPLSAALAMLGEVHCRFGFFYMNGHTQLCISVCCPSDLRVHNKQGARHTHTKPLTLQSLYSNALFYSFHHLWFLSLHLCNKQLSHPKPKKNSFMSQLCIPQAAESSPGSFGGAGDDGADASQQPLSQLASELPHIAAPLAAFLALCPAQTPVGAPMGSPASPLQSSPVSAQRQALLTREVQLDGDSAAAVALPPVLLPRHRTYQLSEKGILDYTGVSLIGMLTQLNLHGSALKKLEVSGCCRSTGGVVCVFACAFGSHDQVLSSSIYLQSAVSTLAPPFMCA